MNDQNFQELEAALRSHASSVTAGSSSFVSTSPESDAQIINIMRLFHNYLASSRTLLEHTRRIVTALCPGIDFLREYQSNVNADFANNPLSRFMQDLRNFTLHRSIPLSGPSVGSGIDGVVTGYYKLDREDLLRWGNWHESSRRFMGSFQGHLLVLDITGQYHQLVSQFQGWLSDALRVRFLVEIQQEEELRNEIRQEMTRARSEEV
jgi:hypothetical protein